MKKNNLTTGAFAVLLLASTVAGADQKYPAADFQPEVLYQDNDYIAKTAPAATAAKPAPKSASSSSAGNGVDSKYPAANFQPEVLYHDPNYKPTATVKKTISKEEDASKPVESQTVSLAAAAKEESSLASYLIGLVVLALAGFFLFKKSSSTPAKKNAPATPVKTSYALNTGVAKYLNKVSGTGVTRYLEKNVRSTSAATGVAKYMAKQAASTKTTAAKAATGVEKYMRDRG
ncbi:MAG: hypothetical protein PHY54_02260 [Methylococcales bacterium]|nr:hypothetical protein [Methylococcales bacterium]